MIDNPSPPPSPLPPPLPQLIVDTGMVLSDLSQHPVLDVALDGADEVAPGQLHCIKGGGACQTQEKLVAAAASTFILVADSRKRAKKLLTVWRTGIPVEVLSLGLAPVMRRLEALGGTPKLRMAGASKAGPVVTDNGNLVVDVDFGGGAGVEDPVALHTSIKLIPGVVETGIFPAMAAKAYFGLEDGTVEVWERG
jgi:ribose 5-phosphate isomerase A